jgi:hypothetical protein
MFNITKRIERNTSVVLSYETNLIDQNFICIPNNTTKTLTIKFRNETDDLDENMELLCDGLLPSHKYMLEIDFDDINCETNDLSEPVKTS